MSATNDAGRLLLIPRGTYDNTITYHVLDVVYYDSTTIQALYVAKGTTTGNVPTSTSYWQVLIDLTGFITANDYGTALAAGLVKSDGGVTNEISISGMLTALGVGIVCTVNPSGTEFGANWLMHGSSVITPDTRQMYRVNFDNAETLFFWDGTQYLKLAGSGGHKILDSVGFPVTARANLRFDLMDVTDDAQNDATVIHSPIEEIPDEATWNSMSQAEKDNPNRSFYLPWMQTGDMLTHERTPIGTIIPFMGTTAPDDYLACDGHQEKKTDYPKLIAFFESTFTSETAPSGDPSDPFGDGNTPTGYFVLPNLQGEFLRGAGTNGHTNQGNGSTVGAHQDATAIIELWLKKTSPTGFKAFLNDSLLDEYSNQFPQNIDSTYDGTNNSTIYNISESSTNASSGKIGLMTSRPTNTSVLWCIKAKQSSNVITFADVDDTETTEDNVWSAAKTKEAIKDVYSTTEQVVGTWIDSKPIYRKVIQDTTPSTGGSTYPSATGAKDINIGANVDTFVSTRAFCKISSAGVVITENYAVAQTEYITLWFRNNNHATKPNTISIAVGTTIVNNPVIIILEYTKTTD